MIHNPKPVVHVKHVSYVAIIPVFVPFSKPADSHCLLISNVKQFLSLVIPVISHQVGMRFYSFIRPQLGPEGISEQALFSAPAAF